MSRLKEEELKAGTKKRNYDYSIRRNETELLAEKISSTISRNYEQEL